MIDRINFSLIPSVAMFCNASVATFLVFASHRGLGSDVEYQRDVKPILTKYCVGCHNEKENESEVQLQTLANIRRGGPKGAVVVAAEAGESSLLKVMQGLQEPKMPPEEFPQPTAAEVLIVQKWIELGANGSDEQLT